MNSVSLDAGIFPRGFSMGTDFPWPLVPAGTVVELVYGDGLTEKTRRSGSIPVYGTNGRCGWHDTPLTKGPGVILGRKGMGHLGVEWCESDFWVIDTAYYVRPITDWIDLKYFYYLVKYIGLNHLKDGTSNPSLTRATFKRLLLPMPPRDQQIRTRQVLTFFDDKIELNRRTNETLEAMARALFKSWFVDFDPVRAKQHGRQPAGMDKATAALFPVSFEDSPLGEIPKGWQVARLSEHVEAVKGLSYKGAGLSDTGIPLHNLNSVYEGGGYKFEGIKHYIGDYQDRHIVRPGDLIVTNTEQGHDCLLIGYAAIVPHTFGDFGLFSHHIYRVRSLDRSPVTSAWLCYLLNSPAMHDTVSGYANGTTVNMLPVAGLQHPEFLLPPPEIIQKFDDFAISILGRIQRTVAENRDLAALRDALLPKLLSGELQIGDFPKDTYA